MATAIEICSNALILIGAAPISSFQDPGAGATAASNLYEDTLNRVLSEHYWRFAVKKQSLNRLSQEPLNEYKYAFQLPTDLITIITVRPFSNYQVFQKFLYSNFSDVELDYVFRPEEVDMPAYFTKALEYRLAADFAIAVTNDVSKNELWERKYLNELAHARSIDSRNTPPQPIVNQPFTDIRFGGGFSNGRGFA